MTDSRARQSVAESTERTEAIRQVAAGPKCDRREDSTAFRMRLIAWTIEAVIPSGEAMRVALKAGESDLRILVIFLVVGTGDDAALFIGSETVGPISLPFSS